MEPQTRRQKKKDQKEKANYGIYSAKHVRITQQLREQGLSMKTLSDESHHKKVKK